MSTAVAASGIATALSELRAGIPIAAGPFQAVRREMVLRHCKWDPQVGDVGTLESFPLLLRADVWQQLANWAESLAAETLAAEVELLPRPDLHRTLAVPRALCRLLRTLERPDLSPRIMRFDFHPTRDGWRISEVNSDVPGGFTEASSFTRLIAAHVENANTAGDPAADWADAIARTAGRNGPVALLSAVGFMEDQQITAYLARLLADRGIVAHLVGPAQLRSRAGRVHVEAAWHHGPVDLVVRFFQAEWLAAVPSRTGWKDWMTCGTPVSNSIAAVLTESKRFPLVWSELKTPLLAWRLLLPETRAVRHAAWWRDDSWLLKSAFCNTGDSVGARDLRTPSQWRGIRRSVFWNPGQWVAQRRFEATAISTPVGDRFPCLGIYTIDGRASGIYGRLAVRPLIDFNATDVAVLVENSRSTSEGLGS